MPIMYISGVISNDSYALYELITEPLTIAVWIYCLLVMAMEYRRFKRKGKTMMQCLHQQCYHTPVPMNPLGRWILPFLWFFALAADGVRFRSAYLLSKADNRSYFFVLFCVGFGALALLVIMGYFARPSDLQVLRRVQRYYDEHPETPYSPAEVTGFRFVAKNDGKIEVELKGMYQDEE